MSAPEALYHALGDSTRLELIKRLGEMGPTPTVTLVEGLGMSRQAATKHLLVLENCGLVKVTKRGREQLRELNIPELKLAGDWLQERAKFWESKLIALKAFAESLED